MPVTSPVGVPPGPPARPVPAGAPAAPGPPLPARARAAAVAPGLAAAVAVAVVASVVGAAWPLVGGPVAGLVLGALAGAVARPGPRLRPGLAFAGRGVLQASIVLLGTGLSLAQVARVGVGSLPVMLGTLAVALGGARLFGRLLRVDGDVRLLIGVGTGVCGASAIAAVTPVIAAGEAEVAYAIGTIFTFNVAAVLIYPAVGHLLGLSQHAFGLWAGTAVNDTSSVVAAAYAYGDLAGDHAVVVKLARALTIVPICLALAAARGRRRAAAGGPAPALPWRRIVPLFIVGFLAASALRTAGGVPPSWQPALGAVAGFLVTVALAGIGLSTRVSALRAAGVRPLLLGGVLWLSVGAASLLLQALTGTL